MTARNRDVGVKICPVKREQSVGHESECAEDQGHNQRSALCQQKEPALSSLQ